MTKDGRQKAERGEVEVFFLRLRRANVLRWRLAPTHKLKQQQSDPKFEGLYINVCRKEAPAPCPRSLTIGVTPDPAVASLRHPGTLEDATKGAIRVLPPAKADQCLKSVGGVALSLRPLNCTLLLYMYEHSPFG